jgi:tetratricopeptide (TPR) repeat protein
VILFSKGLFAEAKDDFEAAVMFDPRFAEAHNNLGAAYIHLGRYPEAFDCCGTAIRLDDSTNTANYLLALNGLRDNQPVLN